MPVLNWLDITIIIIIGYSVLRGYMKGLILSLTGLISLIVALLVANKYYLALTDYLIACWQMDKKLMILVKPLLNLFLPSYTATNSTPPLLAQIIQKFSLYGQNTIGESLCIIMTQGLLSVLCFILLLLITDKLIKIVGLILHSLFDWGFLSPINRVGGMILGSGRGMLMVLILLAIVMPLQLPAVLLGGETTLSKAVNNSYLAQWFWSLLTNMDWSPAGNFFSPQNLKNYFNTII